ncbi:MAG: hypothetical protein KDB74_13585 [Flavobacteriales bacterium]|nr:hypothetical protein [Flavobacteriales bacterium]
MKDWNKTGKIKAVILGILFLPNIIKPIGAQPDMSIVMLLAPFIFGIVAIPFITKINAALFGQIIERPTWNDNPLSLKRPLSLFQFGAFFFLTSGLSMIVGTLIKYQQLSDFGLTSISFGIGILLGIRLLLKMTKK